MFSDRTLVRLPGERAMTRFQRVLLFSAGCGVIAIGHCLPDPRGPALSSAVRAIASSAW